MTYEQTLERIHAFPRFGGSPGVERVRKLLAQLGNPQDRLKYIHVAGTNGKGSTCAMIASVLQKAGYRTGLFTSPFLSDFCERIRVDAEKIPRESLVEITEEVLPVAQGLIENGEALTEFDFTTALGFLWFARQQCDFVVLEVGLGGRNDATNVIGTPLVSVITSISLDHTSVLGDTVEQIAAEKAGIIKPYGVTVAYGDQLPGAMEVIRRAAMKQHNRLVEAAPSVLSVVSSGLHGTELRYEGLSLHLPLLGEYQVKNAATALAALSVVQEHGYLIPDQALMEGFAAVRFPARMELLSENPLVFLDGAHNPDGTHALAETLRNHLAGRSLVGLIGMLADKDVHTAAENLDGLFEQVVTVTPDNPRAMPAEELAAIWRVHGTPAYPVEGVSAAFDKALTLLKENGALVICGSLFLAGEIRPIARKRLREKVGLSADFE